MTRKRFVLITLFALFLALIWPGLLVWRAQQGLGKAKALSELGLWHGAQRHLANYLWLHPRDDEARLFLAEALVKDEGAPSRQAVPEALRQLAKIPDSSSRGALARLQEGRLRLLVLGEPAQAERALRRAVTLDPNSLAAWYMLWKTFDLSGRSQLAEDLFWRVYELSPEEERPIRLREWYMSQFYPATASPELDRLMGFVGAREAPTELTEYRRLVRFQAAEPKEAVTTAALARWFYLEGDPREARRILDEFSTAVDDQRSAEPFYLATRLGVLFDLGEFERADDCFRQWPEPHQGHEYWKWQALVLDEIRGEHRAALAAYDRALAEWPGPVDWRTRSRKANCLTRLRELKSAEEERAAAKDIEQSLEDQVHERVRADLARLNDPAALERVADFYRQIHVEREAQCWRDEARRRRSLTPISQGAAS